MLHNKHVRETISIILFTIAACAFSLLDGFHEFILPDIELPFYHLPVLYAAYRLSFKKAILIATLKGIVMWGFTYKFTIDSFIIISFADIFIISLVMIILIPNYSTSMYSDAAIMAVTGVTAQMVTLSSITKSPTIFIGYYPTVLFWALIVSVMTMIVTKVFDEKIIKRAVVWNTQDMEISNFDEN